MRKGPVTVEEGQIEGSRATRYRTVDFLERIGVAKRLEDGRLAWIDYSELEEELVKRIKEHRSEFYREPTIEQLATYVGLPPTNEKFEKAFWAAAKRTNLNMPSPPRFV